MNTRTVRFLETILIGLAGGTLFVLLDFPLPWVLGPLAFVMLWQGITKRKILWPDPLKEAGFLTLGLYFGMYFTAATMAVVVPYLLPYVVSTLLLIISSIILASAASRFIAVDRITSVFGSIPGGLSEMAIASEALKANTSLVVIFQTVRLIAVLFTVPFVIIYTFSDGMGRQGTGMPVHEGAVPWGAEALWLVLPVIGGLLLKDRIPAGIVIIPLVMTAALNIAVTPLPSLPVLLIIAAQIAVGTGLGKRISFEDLKLGGKYCFVYFGIAIALIAVSFVLGAGLAWITTLNLATALLSVAPGGLIEMVLTASAVGGDPAVVSALQLTRLMVIIILVPPFLKWYFRRNLEFSRE
ncbi:AbrB family transcriptional regulator [Alteribacter natronophilus]|uniref:AbrB family transcriptional regulator n=1 Tax=Alteribacter natronophilus TaxID=2583810 RepID=UPI00110DFA21|nr:AbrB family transcriptional regulator [Alteribacter natronophilus]TMW73424.1 AbrB family transcriptional regulator [Alteribacter natronophilus]